MSEPSLRDAAKSGMAWSFMIQGGTQAINFIVTVLLARLLLPQEFGLIGMIAVFIAISRTLIDGGFVASLIRTTHLDNVDYSTVFFVNLISSILLYLLLFVLAPYIASFYDKPLLVNLIRVLGLGIIINAFSLVQSTKLNRALQFKIQFKLQFPSLIVSAIVSIWMAYNGFGVWSLVAKDLCFAGLATAQLWIYSNWVPSFVFDKRKLKYHFNFGYKLSLTEITNTVFENLYNIIIGKFFSAAELGFYTRSKSLQQLPTMFFFNAFNRVAYPMLAKVKDNNEQLRRIYGQLMGLMAYLVIPLLVFLGIVAKPFIRLLLTTKWLPAVPYFQLLLLGGIFFPIHSYNLNICMLKGKTSLVLRLTGLQNSLLLLGAFTAFWLGIYGLLFSLVFVNVLITFVNAYYSGELIHYGLKMQIKDLAGIFILNFLLAAIFFAIELIWASTLPDIINLFVISIGFLLSYVFFSYVFKIRALFDLLEFRKKNQ